MSKRKTGTREWAESSYNIGIGCSHNCRYCYARELALKFKQINSEKDWIVERLKDKISSVFKKKGWIMFPTAHDITPYYLPYALDALINLLEHNNNVLIVSKPHFECVEKIFATLNSWKSNVLFRFTIGTFDENVVKFWEPGAPSVKERMECLKYSHSVGYATSVSMEPMLCDVCDAVEMVKEMSPYITDKIWLGKMNKIDSRVKITDGDTSQECNKIRKLQSNDQIMWLVRQFKNNPKVEWKDSIKEVIAAQ